MHLCSTKIEQKRPAFERWYVVYTKPRAEELARRELERKKVHVFLPKVEERSPAFGRGPVRITPLFPGYLFVRISIPDDYYKVIWARGVKRLVGNGAGPLPLDDSVIDFLKTKTGERGFIRPTNVFRHQDRVRVKKGLFEGLLGVVDGCLDKRGRIRVLMSLLGDRTHVVLPSCLLEKCA